MFFLVEVISREDGSDWNEYRGESYESADSAYGALLRAIREVTAYPHTDEGQLSPLAQWYRGSMGSIVIYNPELS